MSNHFYVVMSYDAKHTGNKHDNAYFLSESKAEKYCKQIQEESNNFDWGFKYTVERRKFND